MFNGCLFQSGQKARKSYYTFKNNFSYFWKTTVGEQMTITILPLKTASAFSERPIVDPVTGLLENITC
jgi:hypothetical protein